MTDQTKEKKQGLFIPIAMIGTIVGVLVSALAAASTWGSDRERLRTAEKDIAELKTAIKDVAEIKGDVKMLSRSLETWMGIKRGNARNGE